jgi:hypothetical protein
VKQAGIPTGICLTPLLPVRDAEAFGRRLRDASADVYVVQAFQLGSARFAAGTLPMARALAQEFEWDSAAYERVKAALKECLPHLYEGREGFMPV